MTSNASYVLFSDLGGAVKRIAMQFAPFLFQDADRRAVYASLLGEFGCTTHVSVLIDATQADLFDDWVSGLALKCTVVPVPVPGDELGKIRVWIRDSFLCAMEGSTRRYLRPSSSKDEDGSQAQWLGQFDGTTVEPVNVHLDGGDCLVGLGIWFVGAQAVWHTADMEGQTCTYPEALARIGAIQGQLPFVVGYKVANIRNKFQWLLSELRYKAREAAAERSEVRPLSGLFPGLVITLTILRQVLFFLMNQDELTQTWAHVDLIFCPTGRKKGDKHTILVAQAQDGNEADGQNDRLNAVADHLTSQGFDVQRNPTFFVVSDEYILGYNNVIMQTNPDIVWLPQFGGKYAVEDERNVEIWEGLGYEVRKIPGCLAFAKSQGAIRCLTNVVERY
ncbi:hypothetical protein [Taklimakanibacter lacteus]|uniref:hypothetical protein n=1 Tax=Taklimakanibacter lacteus TaxID=2268456 RepID=UPI000E66A7C8